jgi:hypothetical protein
MRGINDIRNRGTKDTYRWEKHFQISPGDEFRITSSSIFEESSSQNTLVNPKPRGNAR